RALATAGNHDHVPDLTRVVEMAALKLPIHDHATADAGAEREHHHVGDAAARPGGEFAEGSGVGIVFDSNALPGRLVQQLTERDVLPAGQIRRAVYEPFLMRHRSGNRSEEHT